MYIYICLGFYDCSHSINISIDVAFTSQLMLSLMKWKLYEKYEIKHFKLSKLLMFMQLLLLSYYIISQW